MKTKWVPLTVWLLVLLLAATLIARTRFTADFSAFLPAAPTPQQQLLVDQLQNGVVARMLLLGIDGGSARSRSAASRQLAAALRAQPEFVAVNNGEAVTAQRDQRYLFDNRYLLSAAVTPARFESAGLSAAIGDAIDSLASPAGLMLKTLFERDPTAEFMQVLESLSPASAPAQYDGVWVARAAPRALLLVQTAAMGADTDAQEIAANKIHSAFAAVKTQLGEEGATLRLQIAGPGVFAVNARDAIRTQVERLALISLLLIVGFLLLIYRSWHLLAVGLLPVATAIAVGIAAVACWFGTVHGITLGFGTTLVGEAVDYAIYFFVQAQGAARQTWRREYWPTIRLGVIISVCGFATLLFSGFPGLAQLGLYSIAGLIAAALTARYVLPSFVAAQMQIKSSVVLGNCLLRAVHSIHGDSWLHGDSRRGYLRGALIVLALVCAVVIVAQRATLWNESLAALSPVSSIDIALDTQLRGELGAPDVRYVIALTARDRETALQHAEQVSILLQAQVERGAIAGFETPSRFLPSIATQQARQQALPEAQQLQRNLDSALRELPLRAAALNEFNVDIAASKQRAPLQRADLNDTSFALAVDSLLQSRGDHWLALMPLRGPLQALALTGGISAVDIPAEEIRAQLRALPIDDVWLLDISGEAQALYAGYFHQALVLSLFGFGAIVIVVGAHLRSLRRTANVIAPLLIAVLLVMAALVVFGQQLNLLHLIGLFLIVAVGSNYALFFARGALQAQTLASLLIANITTVAGFGLLAFSTVPVLQAIGVTVGPGAVLALIISALWSRDASSAAPNTAPNPEKAPV